MKRNNFLQIFQQGYYVWNITYHKQTGVTVASGAYDGIYINNGIEWKNLTGQLSNDETTYSGTIIVNNTIFCVGYTTINNKAKIVIGKN